jgi:hypothetical protein
MRGSFDHPYPYNIISYQIISKTDIYYNIYRKMFRSFAKIFNPKHLGLLGAFFTVNTSPYWMSQE